MGYGTIENESDKKILDCVDRLKDRFISSVQELVRIDSVEREACDGAPFGNGVKHALECALDISGQLGFDTVNLDQYMGYAQYGVGEDYVCAIGHVDVVPAGEGWRQPPFNGYLENGVIYSRGVLDNKGPIMACLYGLAAIKEAGLALKNPVRIIFGCDEESGFEDLKYYLSKERSPLYGFTPDCKYPVVYSERGRAVVRVTGSMDQLETFFDFVNKYFIGTRNTGDRLGIDFSHEEYGMMEMRGYKLSVAPDSLCGGKQAAFDVTLSYPGGATIEVIMNRICIKAGAEGLNAELVQNYDPVVFPKDTPMVKAMQESYELVTGQDGTPVTTTGGTYAKAMPGIVPFGPSFPGQKGISHNPNEWMSVEDLMTNAKIYALALYRLGQL
ncbi:succinyl-diaminopimelate desuccinylase [Lacrimispora sphenoides]|jgi:succinyl-diaminopimelate desuccinylase|uniref:Sapep family Mn(2+)-dependent dipeptidase n=1 Tax=Lacrimispora sphenoides TaxID=29370 RepID=UPI0008B842CA|nr:Sapep family Mn(2+)-dependent dipeptidase [Lacrimispora sphenoides]SEU26041.1 succinyl-diaminopimelate desuccinylase [Lacrimispora sphenoides]